MIVLEDESGEVCEAKYLAEKVGLSGGWRGFSLAHKLVEGDVVVFHLVSPIKFKVTFLSLLVMFLLRTFVFIICFIAKVLFFGGPLIQLALLTFFF